MFPIIQESPLLTDGTHLCLPSGPPGSQMQSPDAVYRLEPRQFTDAPFWVGEKPISGIKVVWTTCLPLPPSSQIRKSTHFCDQSFWS